ncbi:MULTISPECIES: glycine C-acetyltransferase [Asticcacaulis]|uniref:glycine C-acetyltransferase n=1 Tax=Asticcacaulis TaxID=76890 RepID=UPI001AE887E8|nr:MULTISPECIES: glycine C-acetyltransferase [Asticcacaulis]MBP2160445.1 glycine C-acetyltransferase [Asticcacaulis solisilvae]MDR6801490.1 glycine C-acetyltransferase [Asticcacaulis sp. BE141]
MCAQFYEGVEAALRDIDTKGLTKPEHVIASMQRPQLRLQDGREVVNFCANNYLGLADHPEVIAAAHAALDEFGAGLASVRFICGSQTLHKRLEARIASYVGKEDAILFAACFDANGGVFEPLLGAEDAIVSDSLNHASIIDGVRLCKAKTYRFRNADLDDLETQLKAARSNGARTVMIATDGVFSMDGYFAPLDGICELADRYDALVMVDDCHATGFIGPKGAGTPARLKVSDRIDILTGTFGKALSGSMGGYVAAKSEVIALLRQRSRPYLFSNALAPSVAGAALKAIDLAEAGDDLRRQLAANAERFREGMTQAGFNLLPGSHPIIPVMLGEARLAQDLAAALLDKGIYVIGFSFPVVPTGQARIRTQMSAAHSFEQIDAAIEAFTSAGKTLGVI